MKVKKVLISVSDKQGLEEFARGLAELGVKILSTGGTAKKIAALGIPVQEVSDYTGFPEMMDGRVKTLHPKIHGGLLALRSNKEHMAKAKEHGIEMIDMVVVNLYPFEKTVSKEGVKEEEAIENIDIGGPSMLRSAAKNHESVAVICNPERYKDVMDELRQNSGSLSAPTLRSLAVEVFERTAAYDRAIYEYLRKNAECRAQSTEGFSETVNINLQKIQDLRYGENPHQKAAFYKDSDSSESGIASARQLQGKELSFNNIIDLNAAIEIVKDFDEPASSIIKHTNPCGAASASTLEKAYIDALECDRLSAFGSIVSFNGKVTKKLAEVIMKEADFVECLIAPSFDKEALAVFSTKKNLRLLEVPNFRKTSKSERDFKKVVGGFLAQDMDLEVMTEEKLKVATKVKPAEEMIKSLLFSWKIVKHVKSNAIVLAQGTKTVGVGAGQMSRVDSVMIASRKAGSRAKGSALASDAFFPKADAIEQAHKAGVGCIIQPGGSIRDKEVIEACDKFGIPMVFTGIRHFRH